MFYPNWEGAIAKINANQTKEISSLNASQIINLWINKIATKIRDNTDSENDIKTYEKEDDHVDLDAMRAIEDEITSVGMKIEKAIESFEESKDLLRKTKELVKVKIINPVKHWWEKYF